MMTIVAQLDKPLKGFLATTWDRRVQAVNGYFTHKTEGTVTTLNLSIPGSRESFEAAFWLSCVEVLDGVRRVEVVAG